MARRPRILKTEADHQDALRLVESLMTADPGTRAGEQLELWAHLVDLYEREHDPILPPDPIDAIRFRMEQAGLAPMDLVPYLGTRARVSEVLSGKRPLNLRMIRALHSALAIPLASLIRPTAA